MYRGGRRGRSWVGGVGGVEGGEGGAQRGMTKGFNVNDSSPPSLAPRNERVKEIRGSAKI